MDAERRQITVLFTDMVGFTTFSERVGRGSGLYAYAKPVEADGRLRSRARRHCPDLYRRRYHGRLRCAGRV